MNARSPLPTAALTSLEWTTLLEKAMEGVRTETGRARLAGLNDPCAWAPDVATARVLQEETREILGLLERGELWGPLSDLRSPDEAIATLDRSGILELENLRILRGWLEAISAWKSIPAAELRGDAFIQAIAQLPDVTSPARELSRVLTPEGEISERASPRLASLHAEVRSVQSEIRRVLDSILKTLATKNVLQENYSDVRDGRYVIPVRISSQNDVEGILHEASASRQTVFIEPREVTVLNNRLRQKQNDVLQEIQRILQEISEKLRPFRGEIGLGVEILSHWDAVQARGRIALRYWGQPIQVTEDRVFLLEQTAHPLLWWSLPPEQIVRNRIEYGEPARTLFLTGPNTGGKTVFLKTLGLAGICARTGFAFPAIGTPVVPFFDAFFVDVGDPQSIEAHLSSFSGHILRFKEILESVSDRSLVLLDELNSATDPEEGAALGRAFLETLMARGAMIVSTTHDPHLKALALQDPRIVSASMAFDEAARTPTYTILIGVPGRSRAIETAERLGLPKTLLALARSYLSSNHNAFEKMLSTLEADLQAASKAREEAIRLREEAETLQREWSERTQSSVQELLEKTRIRLKRVVEEAQEQVRTTVRKLDEVRSRRDVDLARGAIASAAEGAGAQLDTALREEAPDIARVLENRKAAELEEQKRKAREGALAPGSQVRVPKWKNIGTVISLESGQKVKIALGAMQITMRLDEIIPMSAAEAKAAYRATPARGGASSPDRPAAPGSRLDLRGQRLDVALRDLERYLDVAYRSGAYAEVTIVTGLGTGAIREGAIGLLKSLPYIKDFRDGGHGQGGSGATIVEFER